MSVVDLGRGGEGGGSPCRLTGRDDQMARHEHEDDEEGRRGQEGAWRQGRWGCLELGIGVPWWFAMCSVSRRSTW